MPPKVKSEVPVLGADPNVKLPPPDVLEVLEVVPNEKVLALLVFVFLTTGDASISVFVEFCIKLLPKDVWLLVDDPKVNGVELFVFAFPKLKVDVPLKFWLLFPKENGAFVASLTPKLDPNEFC